MRDQDEELEIECAAAMDRVHEKMPKLPVRLCLIAMVIAVAYKLTCYVTINGEALCYRHVGWWAIIGFCVGAWLLLFWWFSAYMNKARDAFLRRRFKAD